LSLKKINVAFTNNRQIYLVGRTLLSETPINASIKRHNFRFYGEKDVKKDYYYFTTRTF